ncbi:MAG TPA: isochorismatase family protein [Rhizomicrobium sp.]|nr:isochorismatase family protein [Rhizomicrobium sp.]
MSEVIEFDQYHRVKPAPPLVFVDMIEDQLEPEEGFGRRDAEAVLAKCRLLLEEARMRHWPVAFVRSPAPSFPGYPRRASRWIEGFEPRRTDMIFERNGDSCYSNDQFASAMDGAGRVFVVAGFSGESTCLSTVMDAAAHDHFVGLVCDASATRPLPGYDAAKSHRAVVAVASRYATIVTAEHWIEVAAGTAQPEQARPNVSNLR